MASLLTPLLDRPGAYLLRNTRTGTIVARHLEIAGDSASRRRGLLGRDGLDEGHALVIAPCNSIHMFFMRFAIDVLFVARDGRVVKCAHDVRPWRISIAWRAYAAIECPAGTLKRTDTRPGDLVTLEEVAAE